MKPHHTIKYLLIPLLLLLITPRVSYAQEWSGAWLGDLGDFILSDGLLTYKDDGKAGQSDIFLTYTPESSMIWTLECRWSRHPTSFNTFTWLLFEETMPDSYFYRFAIEPSRDGSEVLLIRKYCRPKGQDRVEIISSETLHSVPLASAPTAWEHLTLNALYIEGDGIMIQTFAPSNALDRSEMIPLKGGTIRGLMGLLTKYTAVHKLYHKWSVPTVSSFVAESPLEAEKITAQESGRINVMLNKSVEISSAIVELEGLSPSLAYGATHKEIVIDIGAPFVPNRTYDFTIRELINMQGQSESLSFTIDTTIEHDQEASEMPLGVFITEIMADPPTDGPLSGQKYIELYNNTTDQISLGDLILLYRTTKITLPSVSMIPGELLVLYPAELTAPTTLCSTVPVDKFPALSRDFTLALLHKADLSILDQVSFSGALYGYGAQRGEASVERIGYDPDRWRRSDAPDGGTPGRLTTMRPYPTLSPHSVVINELMLSPSTTGEKYIELYNNSDADIDLSGLYLSYRNDPSGSRTSWSPVDSHYLLKAHGYCVLTPYPESLPKHHPHSDPSTFVERVHLPSLSPTYSEVHLRSRADDTVIDAIIYRRQWLGDSSSDRTRYALERISPDADGEKRQSWRRAAEASGGGTPGVQNSVFGFNPDRWEDDHDIEWPEVPALTYEDMNRFMAAYPDLAHIEVYTLTGQPVESAEGSESAEILRQIQQGSMGLPSMILIVRIRFRHPDPERIELIYSGKWAHTPTL